MKKTLPTLIISLLLFSASLAGRVNAEDKAFTLKSDEISEGSTLSNKEVFKGFGCEGENISPSVKWENVPEGTKSLALTVYDPDAPTGSGWWHWIVYNIPVSEKSLASGSGADLGLKLPKGALHARNDYGNYSFGGACPPVGDKPHRYIFTIYALKLDKLPVPKDASAALIGFYLNANSVAKATVTALFGR